MRLYTRKRALASTAMKPASLNSERGACLPNKTKYAWPPQLQENSPPTKTLSSCTAAVKQCLVLQIFAGWRSTRCSTFKQGMVAAPLASLSEPRGAARFSRLRIRWANNTDPSGYVTTICVYVVAAVGFYGFERSERLEWLRGAELVTRPEMEAAKRTQSLENQKPRYGRSKPSEVKAKAPDPGNIHRLSSFEVMVSGTRLRDCSLS